MLQRDALSYPACYLADVRQLAMVHFVNYNQSLFAFHLNGENCATTRPDERTGRAPDP